MGHAHHFLSRLDRLALPHVELALALYNDVGLLKYILGQTRVPESAERVAISLDDPKEGPFLIVTREGRFVTCLGTGMSPGEWPIVTRGQLDALSARASDLRERMEECRKLIGPKGGAGQIINRIYDSCEELSREDFVTYSAFQPLFELELLRIYVAIADDLGALRDRLIAELRKSKKLRPVWNDALRLYYKMFWAMSHFAMLTATSGHALLERYPEARDMTRELPFSWPLTRQDITVTAFRGAWCAARIGKLFLPTYKRFHDDAQTPLAVLTADLGLCAMGLRHARLRAEVQKTLATPPTVDPETPIGKVAHAYYELLRAPLEQCFTTSDEFASLQRKLGQSIYARFIPVMPADAPCRYERAEDVPDEFAMPMAINHATTLTDKPPLLVGLLSALPWVARAAPEDLLMPRAFLKATRRPWSPDQTYALLGAFIRDEDQARAYMLEQKRQKKDEPTRNGPCPCGSGKKYKRCCGAE